MGSCGTCRGLILVRIDDGKDDEQVAAHIANIIR